jgi:chromosome segregation ATPase
VLRLKSPATESEVVATALRVLETQLAQVADQAANAQLTIEGRNELAQARRKLEELVRAVSGQPASRDSSRQMSADLDRQMTELNRQREELARQHGQLQRQIAETNQQIERMKREFQAAAEAAK